MKDKIYFIHRAIILKHLNNKEGKRYTLDELTVFCSLPKGDSTKRYLRDIISDLGLIYPILSNSSKHGYKIANYEEDIYWAKKQKEENLSRIKRLYSKNRPLDKFIEKNKK